MISETLEQEATCTTGRPMGRRSRTNAANVALIGPREAGNPFAPHLAAQFAIFQCGTDDLRKLPVKLDQAHPAGLRLAPSNQEVVAGGSVILSLASTDQTLKVAGETLRAVRQSVIGGRAPLDRGEPENKLAALLGRAPEKVQA